MHESTNSAFDADVRGIGGSTLIVAVVVVAISFFVAEHDLLYSQSSVHVMDLTFEDNVAARGDKVAAGSVTRPIAFLMLGTLGVVFLLRGQGRPVRSFDSMALMILLFLAWCLVSISWSSSPMLTTKRVAVLLLTFVGALGLSRQLSPTQFAKLAMCIAAAFVSVGLAMEIALGNFRPWMSEYRFAGTVHPTHQAAICSCLFLAAICFATKASRHRHILYACALAGFALLFLTKTRASVAGSVCGLIFLWFAQASARQRAFGGIAAAWTVSMLLLFIFAVGWEQQAIGVAVLGRTDSLLTLTGRIPLWTELLTYIESQPVFGYGYESFWSPERITRVAMAVGWPSQSAHSVYIDILLSVGLVGGSLLLLVVLIGFWRVCKDYRASRDPGRAFILTLLPFVLVQGLLAAQFAKPGFMPFVVFCALVHTAFCRSREEPSISTCLQTGYHSSEQTEEPMR